MSWQYLTFQPGFAQLGNDFGRPQAPDPLPDPRLVDVSPQAAALLGVVDHCQADPHTLAALLAGQQQLPGMQPFAALYAGHQFGHYVPQLGDGRALLLGQLAHQGQHWQWQLKGAGTTPFSRRGDGRAVLRSSIREYLISEAMAALGVPTTRALALVDSSLPVYREQRERGAVVLRAAPSFVRFGSFEVFYYRGQHHLLRQLADHVLQADFPHLCAAEQPYLALLAEVIDRTARLLAHWQAVGFMHGVMNTDNMSILGLTLDYGPFAMMETYQPGSICNHSDDQGRYAFNRQPDVALWNLACLAQALLPLLHPNQDDAVQMARDALDAYWPSYHAAYLAHMRAKLGLWGEEAADAALIRDWLALLQREQLDYTQTHRQMAQQSHCPWPQPDSQQWWQRYQQRLQADPRPALQRQAAMQAVNPRYVLRTWMAQTVIDQAQAGDYAGVQALRALLARPFDEQPEQAHWAQPAPDWARGLVLSCSS